MKYLLLFCLFFASATHAQSVIKATTFEWVGGQCCVRGQDYNISIYITGKHEIVEGTMFIVNNTGHVRGQIHSITFQNDTTAFQVFMQRSEDYSHREITTEILAKEYPKFDGEALIELKFDGELRQLIIPKFEHLGSKAYP